MIVGTTRLLWVTMVPPKTTFGSRGKRTISVAQTTLSLTRDIFRVGIQNMNQVIKLLENQPITLAVLQRCVPHARVIPYDRIPKGAPLKSILGRKKVLIVLYTLHDSTGAPKDGVGHYSLILPGKRNEYFSSYGFSPEQEIAKTHSSGKILRLLGKNYIRNSAALQSKFHSNTCARWCAARALLPQVPLKLFVKRFTERLHLQTPDEVVTLSTLFLFNK